MYLCNKFNQSETCSQRVTSSAVTSTKGSDSIDLAFDDVFFCHDLSNAQGFNNMSISEVLLTISVNHSRKTRLI